MSLADSIAEHVSGLPAEKQSEVFDFVLFLEHRHEQADAAPSNDQERRRRAVASALDALRKSGAFDQVDGPVAWQRETRKDRPLPGRETRE